MYVCMFVNTKIEKACLYVCLGKRSHYLRKLTQTLFAYNHTHIHTYQGNCGVIRKLFYMPSFNTNVNTRTDTHTHINICDQQTHMQLSSLNEWLYNVCMYACTSFSVCACKCTYIHTPRELKTQEKRFCER